jgi:hypothetical protein
MSSQYVCARVGEMQRWRTHVKQNTYAQFIIYVEVKFNGPRGAMKFFSQLPSSRSIAAATFDTRVSCEPARRKYLHFSENDISRLLKIEDNVTKHILIYYTTRRESLAPF